MPHHFKHRENHDFWTVTRNVVRKYLEDDSDLLKVSAVHLFDDYEKKCNPQIYDDTLSFFINPMPIHSNRYYHLWLILIWDVFIRIQGWSRRRIICLTPNLLTFLQIVVELEFKLTVNQWMNKRRFFMILNDATFSIQI